jgi:general secretion pathway protein A
MYNSYFGFREKPFNVTPDPRFFYSNRAYDEAYSTLLYGIRERRGFILLTGEVGAGKTTILRRLMNNLDGTVRFVFFYNTTLTFEEMLSFTCEELALSVRGGGRLRKIQALNEFLIAQLKKGGTAALLIDEAQNLGDDVLENLRLLSNLETGSEKLIQIVLVGQPELEEKLAQPRLRQILQRIAVRYRLDRLKDKEVGPFIDYRLRAVGYKENALFTPEAVQQIAFYSKGIPRLINILCDNSLLVAYATSQKKVSADIIKETARDLRLESPVQVAKPGTQTADAALRESKERKLQALEGIPLRPRPRRLAKLGVGSLLAILLLLGSAVIVIDPVKTENRLSAMFEELFEIFGERFALVGDMLFSRETKPEKVHLELSTEFGPKPQDQAPSESNRKSMEVSDQREPAPSPALYKKVGDSGKQQEGSSAIGNSYRPAGTDGTVAGEWRDSPVVIRYGSTIGRIAGNVYGTHKLLALDLLKEFNSHIDNLNWVFAGQMLWLPPLSRETLVRQEPGGSYRLILESFLELSEAERFAEFVRRKGYEVMITPRRVADNFLLHRVEVARLGNLDVANQAWEIATTNGWISLSEQPQRRKANE